MNIRRIARPAQEGLKGESPEAPGPMQDGNTFDIFMVTLPWLKPISALEKSDTDAKNAMAQSDLWL
jgi:hypothetical protein